MRRLLTPLAWLDAGLVALRGQLTPGQRWTSALAVGLALAMLLFGAPTQRMVVPGPEAQPAEHAAPETDDWSVIDQHDAPAAAFAAPQVASQPPPQHPRTSPAPASVPSDADPSHPTAAAPDAAVPDVVALVTRSDAAPPGRDDRAMAETYLGRASFGWRTVTVDPDAPGVACAEVGSGAIAIASDTLPGPLRDCLVADDVTLIAHDEHGTRAGAAGAVLSTRPSVAEGLVAVARWSADGPVLDGAVGIAAHLTYTEQVEDALPAARAAGLEPDLIRYVDGDVGRAVVDFALAGIEVVVLILPVEQQRRWVALDAALLRTPKYLVVDAADAVVDERYPATFDGAVAVTSVVFPWRSRIDGPTQEETSCRARWEEATNGPVLGDVELGRAFRWCQQVALAERLVGAVVGGMPLVQARTELSYRSPLTTPLGPLNGGGWGPQGRHAVNWRASCTCWTEPRPSS